MTRRKEGMTDENAKGEKSSHAVAKRVKGIIYGLNNDSLFTWAPGCGLSERSKRVKDLLIQRLVSRKAAKNAKGIKIGI